MRMKVLGGAVLAIALVAPANALAAQASVRGVVVKKDAQTSQIVVAPKSGALQRVRVTRLAAFRLGQTVKVTGRASATGIVSARVAKVGKAKKATVRGTVIRSKRGYMLVAKNGAVVRISTRARRAVGTGVKARVALRSGRRHGIPAVPGRSRSMKLRSSALSVCSRIARRFRIEKLCVSMNSLAS